MLDKLKRGDKVYLDSKNTQEAEDITYSLSLRDTIISMVEYVSFGGYGYRTKIFKCYNAKSESTTIHEYQECNGVWDLVFHKSMDEEDLNKLVSLLNGSGDVTVLRDYNI